MFLICWHHYFFQWAFRARYMPDFALDGHLMPEHILYRLTRCFNFQLLKAVTNVAPVLAKLIFTILLLSTIICCHFCLKLHLSKAISLQKMCRCEDFQILVVAANCLPEAISEKNCSWKMGHFFSGHSWPRRWQCFLTMIYVWFDKNSIKYGKPGNGFPWPYHFKTLNKGQFRLFVWLNIMEAVYGKYNGGES